MLILVVEDEAHIREGIASMLDDEAWQVLTAEDVHSAMALINGEDPDVVLCDIHLPDGDAFQVLRACQQRQHEIHVLFMTAFGNREVAVQAIREGAYDYIAKPIRFDELFARLQRLQTLCQMRGQLQRQLADTRQQSRLSLFGDSPHMQEVRNMAAKAASVSAPVLITGETGVGKGMLAQAIHSSGNRADHPLVRINCAAIPETLLESELFGYRRGAFTGADQHKKGLLDAATTGTLFLDEIGEMPMTLQARLLHVLDDGHFRPLGATRSTRFQGRIIAATNLPAESLQQGRQFRQDLFYRLSVISIHIPPLRQRLEDIIPLAERIYQQLLEDAGMPAAPLPARLAETLLAHDWPGNVRELRNTLERSLILDVPDHRPAEALCTLATATERFEKMWIKRTIHACGGDKARAAEVLGIGLSTLYRKL